MYRPGSAGNGASCVGRAAWLAQPDGPRNAQHATRVVPLAPPPALTWRLTPFTAPRSAFTLLEVMIVVGIMGIMLTIGVPIVYKVWHRAPINQAIADAVEVLSNARARAILQGKQVDVVFHPKEGRLEIRGAGGSQANKGPVSVGLSAHIGSGTSATFPDRVLIEMLDINKLQHDFRDDDEAVIRFFPDGTSDELSLVLVSDQNERREITLEVTTALASVEIDPRRFH